MARLIKLILLISLIALVWSAPTSDDPSPNSGDSNSPAVSKNKNDGVDSSDDNKEPPSEDLPGTETTQEEEGKIENQSGTQGDNSDTESESKADNPNTKQNPKTEPHKKTNSLFESPGPFLLQGVPFQTHIPTDQHERNKRNTYPPPPTTDKSINPQQQPHLDPTPPPGYKPKYRRNTDNVKVAQQPSPASLAHEGVHPVSTPKNVQDDAKKQKRDTNHQGASTSQTDVGKNDGSLHRSSGPFTPTPPVHFKTEDGRDGVIHTPPVPGAPPSPKQKRDTESSKEEKKDEVKPATLTEEEKKDEDEEKKQHKQKRDSYSLNHKDQGADLHQHEQHGGSVPQLTPPQHESEYNRHVRETEEHSPQTTEAHPEEKGKTDKNDDDSKSESSEEKH